MTDKKSSKRYPSIPPSVPQGICIMMITIIIYLLTLFYLVVLINLKM